MKIVSFKNCTKVFLLCLCTISYAQNGIGIGTSIPKALLDVYSNDVSKGGILIPRYNADDLSNIILTADQNSMLVYITSPLSIASNGICELITTTGFYYYDHNVAKFLKIGSNDFKGWSTNGNDDITATNFLGTTTDSPLNFKINNVNYGVLTSNSNIGIGDSALLSYSQGVTEQNVAIGRYGLMNIKTGKYNVSLGSKNMMNSDATSHNVAIGYETLNNVAGNGSGFNIAMGYQSLTNGTTVINNISIGRSALNKLVTGANNIAFGMSTLGKSTSGNDNFALGHNSLSNIVSDSYNLAIGNNSLQNLTSGTNNIAIGSESNLTLNSDNTVIIGNSNHNIYKIWSSSWTYLSDQSAKHSISQIPVGLDFIKSLKPVEYIYNNETNNSKTFGFVAQDVYNSTKQFGLRNYGLVQQFDDKKLGLRLNDLFPIITKAIQEQQEVIEKQQQDIDSLKKELDEIKQLLLSKK